MSVGRCLILFAGGVWCALSQGGCVGFNYSTLIDGRETEKCEKKETIAIDSSPSSAKVFVDGTFKGMTPISLTFLKTDAPKIRIEKLGYETVQFYPERVDENKFGVGDGIGGIIMYTIIGTIFITPWCGIDWAIWRERNDVTFSPSDYNVQLVKE